MMESPSRKRWKVELRDGGVLKPEASSKRSLMPAPLDCRVILVYS